MVQGRHNCEALDEQPNKGMGRNHRLETLDSEKPLLKPVQIANASELNSVIFKDMASAPFGRKFFSLFPGLGYAAGYKVCLPYISPAVIAYG